MKLAPQPGSRRPRSAPRRFLPLVLIALAGVSCARADAPGLAEAPPGYADSLSAHRQRREARLRAADGWLTIAGLYWLSPGEHRFGTDPALEIVFPEASAPPRAGTFTLDPDGVVTVRAALGVDLRLDDEPVNERVLANDAEGSPDVLALGRLRFWVIRRGDRLGIRLRDPEAPRRRDFAGIDSYPPDPAFRVEGEFVPYDPPRYLRIENVVGTVDSALAPGEVRFAIQGERHALTPTVEDPADSAFFFVFGDATTGHETYGGGRFLTARLEPGGTVLMDFNRAYNPPCAFNPYTTCPLPAEGNVLAMPVRAGEKAYAGEGP